MLDIFRRKSIFDEFLNDFASSTTIMKTDVTENDDNYLFHIDLPGFKKEDIKISLDNGYLNISAERKENKEDENSNYILKERKYGLLRRKFYVGDIDFDKLDAKLENGILTITVPKESQTTKYLEIK